MRVMVDSMNTGRVRSWGCRHRAARAMPSGRKMACCAAVVLMALACTTGTEPLADGSPITVEQAVGFPGSGLRQRITLIPAAPAPGDTLEVRSVLRNVGTGLVPVTATICGVHLRGSLPFADPFVRCAGYSVTTELAAGDSVIDGRHVVVTAGPGHWVLEVRQLLDPSEWLAIPVVVRIR